LFVFVLGVAALVAVVEVKALEHLITGVLVAEVELKHLFHIPLVC
jgi:hypothetical protein